MGFEGAMQGNIFEVKTRYLEGSAMMGLGFWEMEVWRKRVGEQDGARHIDRTEFRSDFCGNLK